MVADVTGDAARRTRSERIRCGLALCGRPRANGYERSGARDPAGSVVASMVCGPACEGKHPHWVLGWHDR
jgi:hypothetical protein